MSDSFFYGDKDPLNATMGQSLDFPMPVHPPGPTNFPVAGEAVRAIAEETNSIASMAHYLMRARPSDTPTLGYSAVPLVRDSKYEPYMSEFMGDVNEEQTRARMRDIDEHEHNREIMANSGWTGTAMAFAMGVADPAFWLIPGGEVAAGARGLGVLARGALTGAEIGGATVIQQSVLQATNPIHTWGESAENVSSNAVLGGVLGTGIAFLSPAERARAATALEASRLDAQGKPIPAPMATALSEAGAAEADRRTMVPTPLGGEMLRGFVKSLPFGQEGLDTFDRAISRSAWLDPESRILNKGTLPGRRALGDMAELATHLTQEEEGLPAARGGIPIETQSRTIQDRLNTINTSIIDDQFARYRQMEGDRFARSKAFLQDMRGQSAGLMSRDAFKTEIYKALTDADAHPVPEVQAAAQAIRQHVLDPAKELMQSVKDKNGEPILSEVLEPPKGDKSFVSRFWNQRAVAMDPRGFDEASAANLAKEQAEKASIKDRLSILAENLRKSQALIKESDAKGDADAVAAHQTQHDHIRTQIEEEISKWQGKSTREAKAALKAREKYEIQRAKKMAAGLQVGPEKRLTSADAAVDKAVKIMLGRTTDRSPEEIRKLAGEIRNRINLTPEGRLPYDQASADPFGEGFSGKSEDFRGSLNARGYAIPTKDVLKYVHTDIEHVIPAFLRNVIPDSLLINRFGDIRMTEVLKKMQDEYEKRIEAATGPNGVLDPKTAAKIDKAKKNEFRDVTAIRDRIRGVYGLPTSEWERNLGRIARVAMHYNVLTMLNSSVLNRLQDITNAVSRRGMMGFMGDGLAPYIRGMMGVKADKALIDMAKDMQIGVDTRLGQLATNFSYITHDYLPGNRLERTLQASTRAAMIANLHGPWTDLWRQVAAIAAHAEYIKRVERIAKGKEKPDDISALAYAGIDRTMAERIWKNHEATHTEVNGRWVPNTGDWEPGVRQVYESALQKEAHSAVAQPGATRPLAYSKPLMALALQFRSFENAIWRRTIIPNLQMGDFKALQGTLSMIAMGMLSYRLYMLASGRETSPAPQDWIKEGVLRSGMLGPFATMNTLQAKLTNGKTDLFRVIGAGRPPTRRDQTNVVEDAMGPTFKEMLGLGLTIPHAMNGTLSGKDMNNLRQTFVPLQNHMFFRRLLDQAEDGLDRRLGIRPMNRNPSAYPAQ
jgi:hypothetical protein